MNELLRSSSIFLAAFLVCNCYLLNLSFCWSLNDEGVALLRFKEEIVSDPYGALSNWIEEVGVESPCSWSGVGCSQGYVVVLNLKDLCLIGTLAPHIGKLAHLKSIILRNNSFCGVVPEEIVNLNELEVLDIGFNNFSGQLPFNLGNNFSLTILLLDNNEHLDSSRPEIYVLQKFSEAQVDEDVFSRTNQESSCNSLLISRNSVQKRKVAGRTLLQQESSIRRRTPPVRYRSPPHTPRRTSPGPSPSPSRAPAPLSTYNTSDLNRTFPTAVPTPQEGARSSTNIGLVLLGAIGGTVLLLLLVGVVIFCYRSGKVVSVKPWATGLSGQLQRAFVTGVPKLKRSEIEAACEDFSNVIGSSSVGTFYKGTLSSGVEIAVVSVAVSSKKEWSANLEAQFRKKIDTLSKVSHKNFASLLGYCEEDQPFTRMMVFEYAPNGTLFEHIHIREAEHLDWLMRVRIAIGIAYTLDHMHQLSPPFAHKHLTSSSIYLTEDYAAKVSDFVLWDETESQSNPANNVYSFGVILFEIITGRLPYSAGSGSLDDWASDYLSWGQDVRELVDPTLRSYREDQLEGIGGVIRACVEPDPGRRLSMGEVCERLREITGIGPDGAIPKLSPLWWAEIEIMSTEVN
ncbi:hypothetical protein CASFOL_023550 [Castilleja foliolosa]|uniref:Protein kinase domain-containing protein n=1 Tax=Castilleja foliolosa TaxID=1961234 RepID=A0ABD3CNR6_9LAMI